MRQEKTLKPVGNFTITEPPTCQLTNMNNNEKALMWVCYDFSDGVEGAQKPTKLAARFKTLEEAKDFQ